MSPLVRGELQVDAKTFVKTGNTQCMCVCTVSVCSTGRDLSASSPKTHIAKRTSEQDEFSDQVVAAKTHIQPSGSQQVQPNGSRGKTNKHACWGLLSIPTRDSAFSPSQALPTILLSPRARKTALSKVGGLREVGASLHLSISRLPPFPLEMKGAQKRQGQQKGGKE